VVISVWAIVVVQVAVIVRMLARRLSVPSANGRREAQGTRDVAMAPSVRMGVHQTTVAMLE
jgi:hypothetical protein